jgi:hypothetical protein
MTDEPRFCKHCGRAIKLARIRNRWRPRGDGDTAGAETGDPGYHVEWVHSQLYAWIICPGTRTEPTPKHPDIKVVK